MEASCDGSLMDNGNRTFTCESDMKYWSQMTAAPRILSASCASRGPDIQGRRGEQRSADPVACKYAGIAL